MREALAAPEESGTKKQRWRFVVVIAVIGALLIGGLYWRRHSIDGPVQRALAGETDAETSVYRRDWVGGQDIVFNVESVGAEMSAVAMTRRLLKVAEALKDHEFDKVYLAYAGDEKFYLEGSYFQRLGEERGTQNPVYTIRTMPENVQNLDGTPAFGTWTGGWLGVLGEQFEDNNEFHRKWWMDDAIAALP